MRNSGKLTEIELRKKQEIEKGWGSLEENKEVNSDDRIGQLNSLRFEIQSENKNSLMWRIEQISENEMPGMGEVIPKAETYNKYGDAAGGIGIGDIGKHGAFAEMPFSEIPGVWVGP